MVKGNAHIIDMQHKLGAQRGKFRQARLRLKAAPKIIADVARKAALERRQPRQLRQAVPAEYLVQHGKRRFVLHNTIKQGPAIFDFQG